MDLRSISATTRLTRADMMRMTLTRILLAAAVLCCCGCKTLHWNAAAELPAEDPVNPALVQRLDALEWRPNTAWSPISESRSQCEGFPSPEQLRWTAGTIQEPKAATTPLNASAAPPPWLPLRIERGRPQFESAVHLISPRQLGVNELSLPDLRRLARVPGLPGAHASILWAQAVPDEATDVAMLEKLVLGTDDSVIRGQSPDFTQIPIEVNGKPQPASPAVSATVSGAIVPTIPLAVPAASSPTPAVPSPAAQSPVTPPLPAKPIVPQLSPRMRAAAAEAWCLVLAQSAEKDQEAMRPAVAALVQPHLSDELRCELFRGIARRLPPSQIPLLPETLAVHGEDGAQMAPPVRQAAAEACLIYALAHRPAIEQESDDSASQPGGRVDLWPAAMGNLQWDDDPHVRRIFGQWMAVTRHPRAFETLCEQFRDVQPSVSEAALESLGLLHTPAARAELHRLAARKEERIRLFALRGLSQWDESDILPFAHDESFQVRRELAVKLGQFQSPTAAAVLHELLQDPQLQVQAAALEATTDWPERLTAPLLLHALRDSAPKIRRQALLKWEQRIGKTVAFPLNGSREERARQTALLGQERQVASETVLRLEEQVNSTPSSTGLHRLEEIRESMRAAADPASSPADREAALDWLKQLTPADLPALEKLLAEADPQQAAELCRDVLPRLNPIYAVMTQLESRNVSERRAGAQLLSRTAETASLPGWLVRRLEPALAYEQDQLVWRYIMSAIQREDSPEAAQIALLAINHSWPDIRVLGCEYVAAHGRHEAGAWLLPLFADSNSAVQLAAIRAAAQCGNPVVLDGPGGADAPRGVRNWLNSPQTALRLEVAACMSRFGDQQAMQELIRLGLDENWLVRQRAIQEMGASGQTRFIEALIRVGWTESSIAVQRTTLDSLARLVPEAERPPNLDAVQTPHKSLELWAAAWEQRKRGGPSPLPNSATAVPPTGPLSPQ